jgi:pimeloyl-ACP methyl ester carboxylesterase
MPFASVTISSGPAAVRYDITGSGPGVIAVHGTGAGRDQWIGLAERLSDRFTVVAPDLSGSGETTDVGGPLTLTDLADEVLAAADHAGLATFHLIGHSLGAAVATSIAARHPTRVQSLALHAGWVSTTTEMAAQFRYWLELLDADTRYGGALFARMLPLAAFGPEYWRNTTPEANEGLVALLARTVPPGTRRQTEVDLTVDLTDALGRISAPTLVLASTDDRVVPADQAHALVSGIAGARYAEISAGHGAPVEDAVGFVDRLTAFIDEQPSAVVQPHATCRSRRCSARW